MNLGEHLADLLHDLGVHALSLLELLAVTVDNSGGCLGDAEVRLELLCQLRADDMEHVR